MTPTLIVIALHHGIVLRDGSRNGFKEIGSQAITYRYNSER